MSGGWTQDGIRSLTRYLNVRAGIERDHETTTAPAHSKALEGREAVNLMLSLNRLAGPIHG